MLRSSRHSEYLDQLGRLARQGVNVVMHNTLAPSDYSLLDERAYALSIGRDSPGASRASERGRA